MNRLLNTYRPWFIYVTYSNDLGLFPLTDKTNRSCFKSREPLLGSRLPPRYEKNDRK